MRIRRLRPPLLGRRDPAFEIGDGRRHLGVDGIGDAPAVDLDGAHAAVTRGEQRVALRGHLFEGHVCRGRSDSEARELGQGFEFMSGLGCTLIASDILLHEAVEEGRKLRVGIERQDVGDILVRSHDDHATFVSIDTAHCENVVAAFQVGAEHLFVVMKPVAALPGQEKRWHGLDRKFAMALLEDRSDVDHGCQCRRRSECIS